MFGAIAKAVLGSSNDRYVRSLEKVTAQINALEPQLETFSDDELKAQTAKFREQLAAGKKLDDILPEAFATVREASKRVLGMRHFDVQMVGGIVLHRGEIAEMKTGEGKTLVAVAPVYLNALAGRGVEQPVGEQDHAGTGAPCRLSLGELTQRFNQAVFDRSRAGFIFAELLRHFLNTHTNPR